MSLRLLSLICLLAASGVADAVRWEGRVFHDLDGNGLADPDEPGIAGVAVSDGRTLALSDADGRYRLDARDAVPVFVVKPAGWRLPARDDGLPAAWHAPRGPGHVHRGDFALQQPDRRGDRALSVLVFADPQVKSLVDVDHYARDIVAPLAAADRRADLGISLGDIVDDVVALYPQVNAATTRLRVPWLHVPGNHDFDPGADADDASLAAFHASYGPDSFAWHEDAASFLMLDDVVLQPGGRPSYVGGLREDQFAFLEAWLPSVPRDRLLVLGVHIPLFDTAAPGRPATFRTADRERLFALLQDVPKLLVLSGHRHTQRHHRHGPAEGWHGAEPLHEFNVGAASGAFWSGAPDAEGIPDATMADGTPNGHALLDIAADGRYRLSWHPARLPADDPARTAAMHLHAPRALRRGAYRAWAVYANVYMGEADTRVEYRVDGGEWTAMQRVERPDPWLMAENARDDAAATLRGHDRSPEAEPSTHLWRGALPTDLAAGDHDIEVRAFDRWHGEQRAATRYRLEERPTPVPPPATAPRPL
ncbi:calcineurin-like phosphoesterase family protein [Luteimonas sp. MC1750]|uniref:calcineurin-like phosphoesterase C-terminal domain-containing protein n=1 Tax=Luteimonas sp. MC1750 TaxID=2799326 RepID=UPI0018F05E3F|nr:calcineurin-like phosphoesterase family protein [Luteimonas sp. MC1750]MBJ6984298.1 calcineurin-like phosphoesterase family protein [Luteimonas sp. MC1750]QQO05078.1 calcineurin-like phosphoesterase family protein [Luteimonas sp. MC1750]